MHESFLVGGLAQRVAFFYAPKILGGDGRSMIGALEIRRMKRAMLVKKLGVVQSGGDLMVSGYL